MTYIGYILVGLLAAALALMAYVRLAPVNAAVWHDTGLPMMEPGQYPAEGSFIEQRRLDGGGGDVLARLDAIIRETPRTQRVAGSVETGKITYVTRSRVMGFPDYTIVTLMQSPDGTASTLQVYGRLRFGKADLGVNRARILGWLAALDAGR
ncbi:DUF1499 domain-containing protein [Pseudooctadecabacter sp.]|uniref:DUF1499 domain-containing protein n=1 Tax=Pseudooctadecabacter sp. TaxID=1966338 RepID=UPI0035C7AAF8